MRSLIVYVFLLLFACFWVEKSSAQQFNFTNYSVQQGLAQSQVYAMLEDSRGYLWLGTRGGGLCRFDGAEFVTYNTGTGLINNYILALLEDDKGDLWIGTNAGLSRFNGQTFENFPVMPGGAAVGSIAQDKSGRIWLGTDKGVYQYDGNAVTNYSKSNGLPPAFVSFVHCDSKGRVWLGSDKGVHVVTGDGMRAFSRKDGLVTNLVRSITEDAKGNIWLGSYGQGVTVFDNQAFTEFNPKETFTNTVVFSILSDRDGVLWFSTLHKGVIRYNPRDTTFTTLRERDGLAANHVRCGVHDKYGNHWFGTSGGGISAYSGQQFSHFNRSNGLQANRVYALHRDLQGNIWMGASNKGVSWYDGTEFHHLNADSGFINIKVKSIFQDRDSIYWLGTEGEGLFRYDGDTVLQFNATKGMGGNWIRDIKQDTRGRLYVATAGGGITQMTPKNKQRTSFDFQAVKVREGLADARINCLHFDTLGRLWYGTASKGIGYLRPDLSPITIQFSNLPSNNAITSIAEDAYGYLWVGSAGGGVSRLSIYEAELNHAKLAQQDGLRSTNVYLLHLDRQQNLWVGTERGVDKVQLNAARQPVGVEHFGYSEGFTGIETCQRAVTSDSLGNIWFGTLTGLTRYTPGSGSLNTVPPAISITAVRLFYEPLQNTSYSSFVGSWGSMQPGLSFAHDENHISFDFSAVNLPNPGKVQFRWMLEGDEKNWSPASAQKNATYSNLAPGEYTFKVMASNEDGVWSKVPATVSFSVQTPFWKEWWFIAACIAVGVLLLVWIIGARIKRLKRRIREERQRLTLERDMLELEQKALRLQMNPHFIFNALNSIQGVISRKDEKTARYLLAKFSKLMRHTLENSREKYIPLQNEINTLENYLALEQFSHGEQFDFEIKLNESVDAEEVMIPPMLVQPFVENAIIHGVGHLTTKGHIKVEFGRENGSLLCSVTDNGVGRAVANERNSQRDQHHKSTALIVTEERLGKMGKNNEQRIEITDLTGEDGTARGTEIKIRIPLAED